MLPLPAILTIVLMGLVTVGLITWDIIVYLNKVPNGLDTISGRMKAWGKTTLLLPWLWAMLFGHFWGPIRSGELMPHKTGIALLVFSSWCVLILGTILRSHGITISSWPVFLVVLNLGALAGALFWPQ